MKIINIESTRNSKIKNLKKLQTKKTRDKSGQFLVENLLIIYDALKVGLKPISLFVTQELLNTKNNKIKHILDNIAEIFIIDAKINKSFSALATPPGICAVFKKQDTKINFNETIIYLNAVNDPGNVGTILRSSLAFGVNNIVIDEKCADIYNYKTINAAKDAIFKVNIAHDSNLDVFKKIKEKMKVYTTNLKSGVCIKDAIKDNEKAFCVVFGNEANGVEKKILSKADIFIKIDMSEKIESLNVAVSAGIILNQIWNNKSKK